MNPWLESESREKSDCSSGFEDNFQPSSNCERLPDSQEYLNRLESKLRRIKTDPGVLHQLAEKREACLQSLLEDCDEGVQANREIDLNLDAPVTNTDFRPAQEIARFLRPEQALSVGEIVHLVQHDHLQVESEEEEQQQQPKEAEGESDGSR
ncbi:Coiled-coil domain containing protein 32 [Sergentomyia squamirostris]